jgi:hypothetical protein
MDGLTIAFISSKNTHPTYINYHKFGNNYWDDSQHNNSKIGYYFVYYYRQECVYIHKIIRILNPIERPLIMANWNTDRQILCLSEQLKKFTWNEWVNGIGLGSPYTPTYRSCATTSWTEGDLQKSYRKFNFKDLEQHNSPLEEMLKIDDDSDTEIDKQIKELQEKIAQKNKEKSEKIRVKINIIIEEIKEEYAEKIQEAEQQLARIKEERGRVIEERTAHLKSKLVKIKSNN